MNLHLYSFCSLAIRGSICLAVFFFPFSVAATNVVLAFAVILGSVSGQLWAGLKQLWLLHNLLILALMGYLALMILGLIWSRDHLWGLHVLGRQWFWLLVPIGVIAFSDKVWRDRVLLSLSIGLGFHLVFCVAQKLGLVTGTTAGGSYVQDATGHIGHIGFGFVYGIWAAWLILWGWSRDKWARYVPWCVAGWACIMIFLAQGRSGYVVAVILIFTVLWRCTAGIQVWRRGFVVLLIGVLVSAVVLTGPGKQRLVGTLEAFISGLGNSSVKVSKTTGQAIQDTEVRFRMWIVAWKIWDENSLLGVGTGGFPAAFAEVRKKTRKIHFENIGRVVHPHNIYLLALSRWGPFGLAVLLWLLFEWVRTGLRSDWERFPNVALISLSGIALAIHGLSAASLEEHFSGVLAALLLGVGLADMVEQCTGEEVVVKEAFS